MDVELLLFGLQLIMEDAKTFSLVTQHLILTAKVD
jgi:hypothetical protein